MAFLAQTVASGNKKPFFYSSIDNLALGDLAKQVQGLYVNEAEVLQTYKAGTARANAVKQQVDRMQDMLQSEAQNIVAKERSNLESINGQIEIVQDKISDLRQENRSLNQDALKVRQIEREIDIAETTMQTFDKRLQEARIKGETASGLFTVSVIEDPQAFLGTDLSKPQDNSTHLGGVGRTVGSDGWVPAGILRPSLQTSGGFDELRRHSLHLLSA